MGHQAMKYVLALLLFSLVTNVNADVVKDATIGSGYQGNLFNDSNSVGDAYTSFGFGLKYYPASSSQIAARAQYTAFASYSDLSNLTGDLSYTLILTPEQSPFTLALAGAVSARKYGGAYEYYDQVGGRVSANASYHVLPRVYLKSSASYVNKRYIKSDFGSNRSVDLTTGINLSIPGSNSLAFTMSYSRRLFDQPTILDDGTGNISTVDQNESAAFETVGASLRFSRPIGERTGLNLTASHRTLYMDEDYAVLGYTIDYLSPWSDLWEGPSFSGRLKHFFPKQITTSLSFAYYDKTYADVVEFGDEIESTYWRDKRSDQLTTISLSISKPVSLQNGKRVTPSLNVGYRKNQSTADYFEYEDIQVSFTVKFGL